MVKKGKDILYKNLSKYYDSIYSWKNYKKESETITKLILKYKKTKGIKLLEVACGTGKHLQYFKSKFKCTGVDINQEVLSLAKKRIKNVTFKKADMINMKLNKKFDIITCLFSSIGYVKTYTNLKKTIRNFYNHLADGGVVIIEPWLTKSAFKIGSPHLSIYQDKNLKIAREVVSKIKDNISVMDMHYLIAEKNKDVKHFIGRNELGLFEIDKTLKIMKDAGFNAKYLKKGLLKDRGLYIGIKQNPTTH